MRSTSAPRPPSSLRPLAVVVGCAAAIPWLRSLGTAPWARIDTAAPLRWLTATPAEDVVAALLRIAALALCWWLVGALLLAVCTRLVGWRPALAVADRLSPAVVRRVADRLTGAMLLVSSVLGTPAAALASPGSTDVPTGTAAFVPPGTVPPTASPVDAEAEGDQGGDRLPPALSVPVTGPPPDVAPPVGDPGSAQRRTARPAVGEAGRVRVRPGDHLWSIALAELVRRRGTGADDLATADVAAYWAAVVEHNRDRLRSGDPDVVLPGETILLPAEGQSDTTGSS